jgi:prepilin-type N-terminal cleavage/methylation domain-containing protein
MRKKAGGFTLIEVMLAVAIFAFAAIGFAAALNDVLGINLALLRSGGRRQAVESLAAQILASTNNLQLTGEGFVAVSDDGSLVLTQSVNPVLPPIELPNSAPGAGPRTISGWWQVKIRAETKKGEVLEGISFLLWPTR